MKRDNMKILAADLSLTSCALAIVEFEKGNIINFETYLIKNKNSKEKMGKRLQKIEDKIKEIFEKHKDISYLAREKGFSRHAAVTQTLFRVVGVHDLTCHKKAEGLEIEEISPTEIKKLLTGSGKASKEEVAAAVKDRIKHLQRDLEFETDDETDALAVAISFYEKYLKM